MFIRILRWRVRQLEKRNLYGGLLLVPVLIASAGCLWQARSLKREADRLIQERLETGLHVSMPVLSPQENLAVHLQAYRSQFPAGAGNEAAVLERLFAMAERSGLSLEQGEYGALESGDGLRRATMRFPVKGESAAIQRFIATALANEPTLALDSLKFGRGRIGDTQLEASLGFSFYYRP